MVVAASFPEITACVVCRNEADRLRACLESLSWLGDVVVLDLDSTDDSAAIAAEYKARVVHHDAVPVVERVRNVVAEHARHDWILVIDPDERVTDGLARALVDASRRRDVDAVVIPRMNLDFGYAPSHPSQRHEPQLRMYRRSVVSWPTFPNRLPQVDEARVLRLPRDDEHVLLHDRSRNIVEVLERSVRYAPAQAQAMLDEGQSFSAAAMLRALAKELRSKLIDAQAWRDGTPGLMRVGVLVGFKFYVWAELWRLSDDVNDSDGSAEARDATVVKGVGIVGGAIRLAMLAAGLSRRARRAVRV